jgi:peptidoglycan L-alanyl-D-glutamate endopeptidase CwlK
MASRDLQDLIPEFRQKLEKLLKNCLKRGVEMRPYQTLRDPFEQAKYWRQSRSRERITAKIQELKNSGAEFLAYCLESVGPQSGDPVTNALPGLSWHQWGEAVDCFWLVDGNDEWSPNKKVNGVNGYRVYAEEAQKLGLTAGGLWTSIKDWPHVQLQSFSNPLGLYSLPEIDQIMKERFGM